MRRYAKKYPPWIQASRWLLSLGHRLGRWSEGAGIAPRLVQFYLREKTCHGA